MKVNLNENARKWVKALRSGEYSQARLKLRREDGFCCLGVACDLYAKEHNEAYWTNDGVFVISGETEDEHTRVVKRLPWQVEQWLGFTSTGGDFEDPVDRDDYSFRSLVDCNDGRTGTSGLDAFTFDEIADLIEEKAAELFVPESAPSEGA